MKDISGNQFWGKQKPLKHYFNGGSLSFGVKNGKLSFIITITSKKTKQILDKFEVKDKEHLDRLLKTKSLSEVIN